MKKNSFIIVVVILIIVILGLCAFIIYDKDLFNIREKNITENNKKQSVEKVEEKEEILDVNSKQVNTLINQIIDNTNNIYISGSKYFGYYFQKEELDSKNIDNDIILYTGLKKVLNDKNIDTSYQENISVSKDELIPVIKSIFGDVQYENKSISITPCDLGKFVYDNNTGIYTAESQGCGGVSTSVIKHKVIDAIKKDNKIEITLAIVYVDCFSNGTVDYCKFGNGVDENQKVKEDEMIMDMNMDGKTLDEIFDINAYIDKLNKYKFTFTKDSNDNYVFTKVEKNK